MKATVQLLITSLVLIFTFGNSAHAASYNFNQITDNGNGVDITAQLSMDVDSQHGGALFTFYNTVGTDSSIAGIFFDEGTSHIFTSLSFASQSSGVIFSNDRNSKTLPGGSSYGFSSTFSASKDGAMANGVNHANEWVSFFGTYNDGKSYSDLNKALTAGLFRTGLHLISIGQVGGSDSFINVSEVPLPAAFWLFAPALIGLLGFRRTKKN